MNFIKGRTRVVILVWGLAIKFPNFFKWKSFLAGLQCNMREYENAERKSEFLAEMLWFIPGGWVNVMRKADTVFPPGTDNPDDIKLLASYFDTLMKSKNKSLDLDCMEVAVRENYGIYKGKVVCIDYAEKRNQDLNEWLIEKGNY